MAEIQERDKKIKNLEERIQERDKKIKNLEERIQVGEAEEIRLKNVLKSQRKLVKLKEAEIRTYKDMAGEGSSGDNLEKDKDINDESIMQSSSKKRKCE